VLHESGRLDEAYLHITRAKELDPLSSVSRYVRSNILMSMRRYDEARLEVLTGLDLDPDFAHFYQTLINAEVNLWNWQGVLDAAERALKRPSTEFFGIIAKVTGLWILGDRDTADEALDRLVEMSNRIAGTRIYYTARLLYYAQRYEEALAIYEKDPTEPRELAWRPLRLAYIRTVMGDLPQAAQLLEAASQAAERLDGNFARPELFARNLLFYRGLVAALDGRSVEARELVEELEADLQGRNLYYDVARLRFAMGDVDQGFDLLNRAIAARAPDELAELPVDPLLDPYRDDPRFQAILGIMGLAGARGGSG